MIRTQVTIVNKRGLHARAAQKFVACSCAFSCQVRAGKDDQMVDAKSIMSVMMLAAGKGAVLNLELDGADEEAALCALKTLIEDRFGEPE